jgi:hydrogenase-1 operon protein HyaF
VIATTVRHVWAVQYVNAMGNTILDTLEIGRVPDAVVAASQDLEDSARRLDEILDTYLT